MSAIPAYARAQEASLHWVPTAKRRDAMTSEIAAIRQMAGQGLSKMECAKRLGRSRQFVNKWAVRYSIEFTWSPYGRSATSP